MPTAYGKLGSLSAFAGRFAMGYAAEGSLWIGIIWCWVDGVMILSGSLKMKDGRELP